MPAATRPATYKEVCTGQTGHAEVVRVTFDPSVITFSDLLTVFFATHDPTTLNRQGADSGHAVPLGHLLPEPGAAHRSRGDDRGADAATRYSTGPS